MLTRSIGGRTMLASGPMFLTFQPLSKRAQNRERQAIAAAARDNANVVSQRGMFNMQLKARPWMLSPDHAAPCVPTVDDLRRACRQRWRMSTTAGYTSHTTSISAAGRTPCRRT